MTERRHVFDRRRHAKPPPEGVEQRAMPERRRGRPPIADTRRHRLRLNCSTEEVLKFQMLAAYNRDLKMATMLRDIILDDVNDFLAHCPRLELVKILREMEKTDVEIEAILKTL